MPNPVTPLLGSEGVVTAPAPDTSVHTPLFAGLFAASVAVVVSPQKDWLGPASASIGLAITVTEEACVQPSTLSVTVKV
jgi:hypothetical protein